MSELKILKLYGILGAKFGRVHKLAVNSPQEAVKALSVVVPGFEKFMINSQAKGLTFAVFKGKRNINKEELVLSGVNEDIRIAPI
ncbi:tail assembly protein, partial [Martelella alba]